MEDNPNVGGLAIGRTPGPKVGVVQQQINLAGNQADNLANTVEVLFSKITPVLGVIPPTPDPEVKLDKKDEELPELADSIRVIRRSVMESIKKLEHLCKRIEL